MRSKVVKKEAPKKRVVVKKEAPKKRVDKKVAVKKESPKKVRKPRYADVPKELFCGPSGGARAGSYPVNSPGRAIAAMSYARFAPNPQGIKECARRIALSKGWVNPKTGKIRRVK